jgi:hypothetical protein
MTTTIMTTALIAHRAASLQPLMPVNPSISCVALPDAVAVAVADAELGTLLLVVDISASGEIEVEFDSECN